MKINDLIEWFEKWANPALQESWDNSGWQIEPGVLSEVARVLVCLTPTLPVMHEAISLCHSGIQVNLIFAHHPLIFSPIKSLCRGEELGEIARLAFIHKIGIYSAHTNFDQVKEGTADVLAQLLKLRQIKPVIPTTNGLGYGCVGNLEPAMSLQKLLEQIKIILNPPEIIHSPVANLQQTIQKLAVLGGSGASFISDVVQTGAQAYLTSDCKFHQFQESRAQRLILIDAGHYATERPACKHLVEKFRTIGVEWVQLSTNDEDFRMFYHLN